MNNHISKISIENIKGFSKWEFNGELLPNKPHIFVAPNGYGKSSFAIAFKSLNKRRIALDDKHIHKRNPLNKPKIEITYLYDTNTTVYSATDNDNKMETTYDGHVIVGDEEKMRFVVGIAVENVRQETGGPFAAAIFDIKTDRLIALGVNSVVPSKQSWTHAEMTAFAHAQSKLNTGSLKGCMLVTSCEPCAMCSGATPWSGVERVIYGAPRDMAEKVGFDEGYKGRFWEEEFESRKIHVAGPMLGEEAFAPFELYQKKHGKIY